MTHRATRADDGTSQAQPRLFERASVVAAALVMLHAVLCWLARRPGILTGQDDVEYLVLGESLRHGGYNLLFRVDSPLHAQYPPGYPSMIAIWGLLFGDGFNAQVALVALLSAASLAIVYIVLRRVTDPVAALACLAVLAVNPALIRYSSVIAAEAPFTALAMSSLAFMSGSARSTRRTWIAGALAITAAMTRSIGIVVPAALMCHLALGRRWKAAAGLGLASAAIIGPWMIWTAMAPEVYAGHSYIGDAAAAFDGASSLVRSPFGALVDKVRWLSTIAVPTLLAIPTVPGTILDNALAAVLLWSSALVGMWLLFRVWPVAAIFAVLYGASLVLWPYRVERFVAPAIPILVPAILLGIGAIAAALIRTGLRPGATGAAALVLAASGIIGTRGLVRAQAGCHGQRDMPPAECMTPTQAAYFEALRYIRVNTPEDAVFLVAKSGALYYYTGRRSVPLAEAAAQGPETFLPMLSTWGTTHILIASLGGGDAPVLAPLMESNCTSLALERRFGDRTLLFRLNGGAEPADRESACEAIREYRASFKGGTGEDE